jgi:hypothetical protein
MTLLDEIEGRWQFPLHLATVGDLAAAARQLETDFRAVLGFMRTQSYELAAAHDLWHSLDEETQRLMGEAKRLEAIVAAYSAATGDQTTEELVRKLIDAWQNNQATVQVGKSMYRWNGKTWLWSQLKEK